jgi:hypothetical protein
MNKKSIIILFVLVLLTAFVFWLINSKKDGSTISKLADEYAFNISDTASIDKLIIRDKTPSEIIIVRTPSGWEMEDGRKIRQDAVEVLMETFYRQELRNFVPENSKPNVLKSINVTGREVQVFQNGKKTKHFFVGSDTPDQNGTYMLMKGASQPYAVHIQGFNGYLSTRFFASETLWLDRTIFGFDNLEIASAAVKYFQNKQLGFQLEVKSLEDIRLFDYDGQPVVNFNKQEAQTFISAFRSTKYEGMIVPGEKAYDMQDSIKTYQTPAFIISARTHDGRSRTLTAYYIKAAEDSFDPDGTPLEWDQDRLYAFIDDSQMVLIQYYGMAPLLRVLPDFTRSKNSETVGF